MNVTQYSADYWNSAYPNYSEDHHVGYPIKQEQIFTSCQFSIPPPTTINNPITYPDFTSHLNPVDTFPSSFYYNQPTSKQTSFENKPKEEGEDSPALRALLSKPIAKKPDQYENSFQNNNTIPSEEDFQQLDGNSDDNISDSTPMYPWMKPHGNKGISTYFF